MSNFEVKEQYCEWLASQNLSPRTIKEYGLYFNRLYKIGLMNQKTVDRFLGKCKNPVARAFIKSYQKFLLRNPEAFGLTPEAENNLRKIDIIRFKKRKRQPPETITEDELFAIAKELKQSRSEGAAVMLLLSYYAALRVSELVDIRVNDFNWNQWTDNPKEYGLLKVTGKGNKVETIPIRPEVMMKVRDFLGDDAWDENSPIFSANKISPLHNDTWRKILKRASIQAIGRKVKPHSTRHSRATELAKAGVSINVIQKFLRHEDISTTALYITTDKSEVVKGLKKIDSN